MGFHYMLGREVTAPRIGVSASRAARAIANDIERRLLPNYTALYDQALTAIEAQQKQLAWCDHITALIQRMLGAKLPYNGRSQAKYETQRRLSWGSYQDPNGSGEVTISAYNGGSIDLTLSDLPPDKVIKLLAFYQQEIINDDKHAERGQL